MSAEYICDGCGRRSPAIPTGGGSWAKPRLWFQRSDEDGVQDACSRDCIDKIAEKTGSTRVVIPGL